MSGTPFQNICLIRLSALGDIVHALALVNGLKKAWPGSRLTWILHPLSREVVKYQENIDEFIIVPKKNDLKSWKDLYGRLKDRRFDLVLVPQVSVRASMITALVKADVKLGYDFKRSRELNWLFVNRKIPHRKPGHVQDQFLEFLEDLQIDHRTPEWHIAFTEEEIAWREEFFRKIQKPVISLVIATSDPKKDWSPEGYAAVADHVALGTGFQPMLVGGPSKREAELADRILSLCHCSPVVALEKPLRRTMLQLSGSSLVVSPDTGPLHMAVALDVPVISLYGASDPRRCGPYKKFHDLLINKYSNGAEVDTPIRRKLSLDGMSRISPEEVTAKIDYAIRTYSAHTGEKKSFLQGTGTPLPCVNPFTRSKTP
jgi:heptosyltransferase I